MDEPPERFLADPAAIEAINSLDTARLSLRWALERIHALESVKEDLSRQVEREGGLREKAQKDYEGLERLLALRPEGPAQRALFERQLETLVTLKLAGKLDLAPLAAREEAARRLEETLAAERTRLEVESEKRRRELDEERRRLKAELESESRAAEERRRRDWSSRQETLEKDGLGRAAELHAQELRLREREQESAVSQARLEEQLAARSRELEAEKQRAQSELSDKLAELSAEAQGLWAEREKTLRVGFDNERKNLQHQELDLQKELAKKAVLSQGLQSSLAALNDQNGELREALQTRGRRLEELESALRAASQRLAELESLLAQAAGSVEREAAGRQAAETGLREAQTSRDVLENTSRRLEALLAGERSAREAERELAGRELALRSERLAAVSNDLSSAERALAEEQARVRGTVEEARGLQAELAALEARARGMDESLSLRDEETQRERAARLADKDLHAARLAGQETAYAELQKRFFQREEELARERQALGQARAETQDLLARADALTAENAGLEAELIRTRDELRQSFGRLAALENAKAQADEDAREALKRMSALKHRSESLLAREQDLVQRERRLKWSQASADSSHWDKEMRARYDHLEDLEKRAAETEALRQEQDKDILRLQEELQKERDASRRAREEQVLLEKSKDSRLKDLEKQLADSRSLVESEAEDLKSQEEENKVLAEAFERFKLELTRERQEAQRDAAAQTLRVKELEEQLEDSGSLIALEAEHLKAREDERRVLDEGFEKFKADLREERAAADRARVIAESKAQEQYLRIRELEKSLGDAKAAAGQFAQDFHAAKEELERLKAVQAKPEPAPAPQAPKKPLAGEDLQDIFKEAFARPAALPAPGDAEKQLLERLKVVKLETEGLYADLHLLQAKEKQYAAEIESLKERLAAAQEAAANPTARPQETDALIKAADLQKELYKALSDARQAAEQLAKETEKRKKLEQYINSRLDLGDFPPKA